MFEFWHIWLLGLLPLPLLVRLLLPPHRQVSTAIRVPFFDMVAKASGEQPKQGAVIAAMPWMHTVFAALVWGLAVLALAQPQWVGEPIEKTEATRDIMLAIDLSGSMDQRDFAPEGKPPVQRLEAVKQVIGDFIEARDGDRVGLVVFGTKAYVLVPFTRDLETVRALLTATEVGMAGPHTAIGDAIGLSIKTFEASKVDERQLLLLTDGSDTGSLMTPLNAADIARQNNVTIFTVGVGDPEGTGENHVDFDALRDVAKRADGLFFQADDAEGLSRVYERIDQVLPRTVKTISYRPKETLVHFPAGAALVLCLVFGLFIALQNRRKTMERVQT